MFIIVILGLILIFFLNYKFLGNFYSVLNPVSISIYVWILVVVCHNYYFSYKQYTDLTYLIILLGNIALAIGFWGTAKKRVVFRKHKISTKSIEYDIQGVKKILKVLTFIEIIRIAVFLHGSSLCPMLLNPIRVLFLSYWHNILLSVWV